MAQAFVYFLQLFTLPLNETSNYTRPAFSYLKFWIKDFGWWILIAAAEAHVADLLDTVHHEMDKMVCSHLLYKSVWFPVIGEWLVLEKEPAGRSTQWICSGSDQGFSDSGPHSAGNLFTHQMVFFYYTKGLCHPLSSVCHINRRRRKGKGLEVPCI